MLASPEQRYLYWWQGRRIPQIYKNQWKINPLTLAPRSEDFQVLQRPKENQSSNPGVRAGGFQSAAKTDGRSILQPWRKGSEDFQVLQKSHHANMYEMNPYFVSHAYKDIVLFAARRRPRVRAAPPSRAPGVKTLLGFAYIYTYIYLFMTTFI